MEPYELSLSDAAAAIAATELSPVELTDSVLGRIEAVEGDLNAFVTVTADLARASAAAAAEEIAHGGHRGPLHGIPIALKDLYDTAGVLTTSSSAVRATYVPERDSAVAERFAAAGAVLVGKTHTHEFAYGATTPTTRNPWDTTRVPGGSSGGSGAAVAAGECMVGMGSDTGGSIRIPASVCGVVGLKPTYGRVSRRGVASLSWSLDHVGPLTRTVRDAALTLNALAGYDRADPGSVDRPVPDFTALIGRDLTGMRVGVPTTYFTERLQDDVRASVAASVARLEALGATLVEVEVPMASQMAAVEWGLMLPEASAYHQEALRATPELFTAETRGLLDIGELVLATDYIKAQRVRGLVQAAWAEMFTSIDVLAAPTLTCTATLAGQDAVTWPDGSTESPTGTYVRFSQPANVTGLPSITVPTGVDAGGLPIGMQIVGRPFEEDVVIGVAAAYEADSGLGGQLAPLRRELATA
ncbi:amidase [Kineococcus rubinsiae]|uniref:amidase n=1 Tax=Kineococcus rubinsiae TaxID=2609562 RepID=UPI00142F676D|nr:amidase [Kineococcus rubinsiae]NIZ92351.1 amidase [Kineococcus rubinsiae]